MTADGDPRDAPPPRQREYGNVQPCKMDAKGRVVVHRDMKKEQLCLTGHFAHPCLVLYPVDEWSRILARLGALLNKLRDPEWNAQRFFRHANTSFEECSDSNVRRTLQHRVMSHALSVAPDTNGRIMLPEKHRSLALMNGQRENGPTEIAIVGVGRHVQLWESGRWDRMMQDMRVSAPGPNNGEDTMLRRYMLSRPDLSFLDAWYDDDAS